MAAYAERALKNAIWILLGSAIYHIKNATAESRSRPKICRFVGKSANTLQSSTEK